MCLIAFHYGRAEERDSAFVSSVRVGSSFVAYSFFELTCLPIHTPTSSYMLSLKKQSPCLASGTNRSVLSALVETSYSIFEKAGSVTCTIAHAEQNTEPMWTPVSLPLL
eukprot:SAG31_NODE_4425_length_3246_cov_1.445186_4_plen_109_part_00